MGLPVMTNENDLNDKRSRNKKKWKKTPSTGKSTGKRKTMKSSLPHSRTTLTNAELKKSLLKRNTVMFHTSEAELKFERETKTSIGTECEFQTRTWLENHSLNSTNDENLSENEL